MKRIHDPIFIQLRGGVLGVRIKQYFSMLGVVGAFCPVGADAQYNGFALDNGSENLFGMEEAGASDLSAGFEQPLNSPLNSSSSLDIIMPEFESASGGASESQTGFSNPVFDPMSSDILGDATNPALPNQDFLNSQGTSALNNLGTLQSVPLPSMDDVAAGGTGGVDSAATDSFLQETSQEPVEALVSVDFRATSLGDVLRILADASKLNLIVGTSVKQDIPVTLRLHDVTYQTALESVLNLYGLKAKTENNIVKIEEMSHVQNELETRRNLQVTEWNSQPTRILVWQLNFAQAPNVSSLVTQMVTARFAGLVNFTITADERTNRVIIESIPDVLERCKSLLQQLDSRRPQVQIEARILEASREVTTALGVQWGARFGLDGQRGLSSGLLFPNFLIGNIGGAGRIGSASPQPGNALGETRNGSTALSLGSINGLINLDAVIDAYESENLAYIIASPKVTVEDRQSADISETTTISRSVVVGEVPAVLESEFSLGLKVTPEVSSDGTIRLNVDVSRDSLGGSTNESNTVTSRKAQTRLMVRDGQTTVIGGLYQSSRRVGTGGIPGLSQIPILGALFRTRDETNVRTELMVLITPRILRDGHSLSSGSMAEVSANSGMANASFLSGTSSSDNNFNNQDLFGNSGGEDVVSDNVGFEESNNSSFSDNEFGNNEFTDNNFVNDGSANNNFANDEFTDNNFVNDEFPNNNFTNNNFVENEFINSETQNTEMEGNDFDENF